MEIHTDSFCLKVCLTNQTGVFAFVVFYFFFITSLSCVTFWQSIYGKQRLYCIRVSHNVGISL